ncbi:extracellular solute-binding protein [Allobaculum mucilyticum]|uniref:extracellular solute-binding protein n=1 Tax=Allobaculum mucilyticum TaxID=2834459 RepID=UPI001E419087|nr:extracellular solute-binding protein [Allobaculum mucilyticum]UNT95075.1 extracellular solute-binding protein [Allobaculum mucilyticum]
MKKKRPVGALITTLIMIFFYVPIVFMIIFSFNSSKSLTNFTGFSLKWYEQMFASHDMMNSLYVTIVVAVLATVISTIIGTITAIGLRYSKKLVRAYVTQINDLPMMNPDIVTAIGLMLLFITFRIERGFATLLLAHIAFCIPYVMLSVIPKLRQLDPNLADAAMDLGATPFQTLTKVIVPEIMPGIVSGALIAFTMSFDDFIISYFATGQGVKNLSIMVYTMAKRVNPSINAISTLLVLLITIILLVVNIWPVIREKIEKKRQADPNYLPSPHKHTARNWSIFAAAAVAVSCILFFRPAAGTQEFAGQTLHLYLPGEYISDEMLAEFENKTGSKVVVDNFDSNEQMYIKIANGDSFDVLIPSDYMIQRLIGEDLLMKLDPEKVDEALVQIDDQILDLPYDPQNQYSVPYFWGTVGIVYDKNKVDLADLEKDGWGIFADEKYKGDIYLYDSERDQFMAALKNLGYSMNTSDPKELAAAYDWLVNIVQTMEPEIVTDEIIDNMANGRKALGMIYSGDATYVMQENENMGYYLPKEGTNVWVDAMCIPKNAQNVDLAYAFINYVAGYEAQMMNSTYVGYTAANKEVEDELASTDFEGINSYVPRTGYDLDETFEYNPDSRKTIADYWSRVKVVASNSR